MKRTTTVLFAAALMILTQGAIAQALLKVKANKMTVQGSSTLHDWESQITRADIKGVFTIENDKLVEAKNIEVKIPVESIKSTKGKMMDGKTWDAFNYEKYPFITYSLSGGKINEATGTIDAKGSLTMAGVTRPFEVQAKYKVLPGGELQIILSRKFKMTEFKMETPTAMMGSIKVGDEVTVNFDLTINTKILQ